MVYTNYCNSCNRETYYSILAEYTKSYNDDYQCTYKYQVVSCNGCNYISFRQEFHDIEGGYPAYDLYSGEEWTVPVTVETYPKAKKHKLIDGSECIPEEIYRAYTQTLTAYQEDATILAGIGFRAIVEAICADQSVKENNLQTSITKLYKNGILSKHDSNLLHSVRFLGNDAAHEIKDPKTGQLDTTLKIIEHLLISLYILPKDVARVMETVVEKYEEFEALLIDSVSDFSTGEEVTLKEILGSKMRRFIDNFSSLQTELNSRIAANSFTKLAFGKHDHYNGSENKMQYYTVVHD
ncbi:hypothetical protein D3C81_974540 [compost metagenome]